jgi:branched-chain amino acid transport system permease protein
MASILQKLLNGLSIGGVYAVFAVGYTLVFSVLRIINLAHGAVFSFGAYVTYFLAGGAVGVNGIWANTILSPVALPFWLAIVVSAIVSGAIGVGIEYAAFRPLRRRNSDPLLSLVSSLGVALVIVNVMQYLFGADPYSYGSDVLGSLPASTTLAIGSESVRLRTVQVVIFVVSVVLVAGLSWFVRNTRNGKALQAVSEDATTARLLGIDAQRLIVLTFFLSGALAGVAGTLVGVSVSIAGPFFGTVFGLKGLAVIVLGGLGDIRGAVLGGIVIGLAEAFVPADYIGYKEGIAFVVLFLVLMVRPQGLLNRAEVQKV